MSRRGIAVGLLAASGASVVATAFLAWKAGTCDSLVCAALSARFAIVSGVAALVLAAIGIRFLMTPAPARAERPASSLRLMAALGVAPLAVLGLVLFLMSPMAWWRWGIAAAAAVTLVVVARRHPGPASAKTGRPRLPPP